MRSRATHYLRVLALFGGATAALVVLRSVLGLAAVALVYLLIVFLSAVWWGRGPSLLASVLAFSAVNFFFTVPYNTFIVASTQDVISLAVFLLVAVMTSRLVNLLRERETYARHQAWEASTLHALSDAVTMASPGEILPAMASRIVGTLGVRECAIFLSDTAGRLRPHTWVSPDGAEDEVIPGAAVRAFITREAVEEEHDLSLPLIVGEKVVGVLYVAAAAGGPLPEATERLLRTFAEQAAVVIERLRLQEEAAQAEILRRTDDLKSELLSAVSHDLRTPLASIRLAATALHQDGARWEEGTREELLEMIDAEATRLSRLVGNLLDLSRIEAGALHPEKEWRDLNEVVARAIDALRDRLRGRRLGVVTPENLPLIPLDFTQIEDVLVNLLDNAARYSPEGSQIRVVARSDRTEVVVQVENEGPPIPVDAVDEVFDRFYKGRGDAHGRAGLGLAICKGLIEAHGGRIWVERPGEPGARFAFSLPLEGGAGFVGERPPAARQ